ncbi:hypothetical protein [Erwinia sp. 198]|uniref:hypothetical protein n=1 Tax=Erwinia sp. 198 TaxID=2022746 RepID=UPI000F65F5B2|nr:hypothetical protein [Erwinia sp. 198]RRZ93673.1 hypothetical protein EGK14_07720 [Erwinia sp. 198]
MRPKPERERQQEAIAADCLAAWQAAKDGEQHHRHFSLVQSRGGAETARMASEAAHYPQLPQILMPEPFNNTPVYHDYTIRIHGAGRAEKQEWV